MTAARDVRFDPFMVQKDDLPALANLSDDKANRKLEEVRKGAGLQNDAQYLPDKRPCRDCIWVLLFLAALGATCVLAASSIQILMEEGAAGLGLPPTATTAFPGQVTMPPAAATDVDGAATAAPFAPLATVAPLALATVAPVESRRLESVSQQKSDAHQFVLPKFRVMLWSGIIGAGASILAAFAYILLARSSPACVVWSSLIFGPLFTMVLGAACLAAGQVLIGGMLVAVGCCTLFCTCFCWRSLIPFMIEVTQVVADVISEHPCMFTVGLVGSLLSMVWTIICFVAFAGVLKQMDLTKSQDDKGTFYGVLFGFSLVFIWGGQVFYNVCHVTYSGVFARWYFGKDDAPVLVQSFQVALTTSYGSICMGSFLVSLVRAIETVVSFIRRAAQEDGNPVLCIVACIVECFISCIGDILEYFNEWAYVQCAVRGVSFCDAAKITYSMLTCANVQYILSDLLLDSLVNFGSFICAVVGAGFGAYTGHSMGSVEGHAATAGGILGFVVGFMAGSTSLGVFSSGVKTILMCWADDPDPLQKTHPEINQRFVEKIQGKLYGDGNTSATSE